MLLSCSPCPRNLFDTFDFKALSTAGTALRLVAFPLALGAAIIALAARWLAAPPAWRRVLLWVVPPGIVGLFLLLIASVFAPESTSPIDRSRRSAWSHSRCWLSCPRACLS